MNGRGVPGFDVALRPSSTSDMRLDTSIAVRALVKVHLAGRYRNISLCYEPAPAAAAAASS